ncbi:MAG: hypothetical protein HYU98_04595 [Deltaproteobacteria bacterium]|nr:hypothetical protein [Deltaproteobacteria bacterium]
MINTFKNPYLSLVIASRNDEHGGNPLQRTMIAFNGFLTQLENHKLESELILVDWNPPAGKPLLKDVIKWPDRLRYCTIRSIIVPSAIHMRYKHSDIVPLHTVVAVNCGIRRARGQFVLPGVIDLLYSDELMSYIASKKLKKDERYRVDRCDVDRNVVQYPTLKEQLDYARKHIIKINSHQRNDAKKGMPDLHTNACGDFQLMSRHYWHLLRGYREAEIVTSYIDGLLSYASYAAGVKEVILAEPMRIYHIDHDNKFTDRIKRTMPLENWLSLPFMPVWFNNKIIALYRMFMTVIGVKMKSRVYGVPVLEHTEYEKMCHDIVAGRRSYIFNDENWGLDQESLEEFVINTADWDKEYERENEHR